MPVALKLPGLAAPPAGANPAALPCVDGAAGAVVGAAGAYPAALPCIDGAAD